MDLATYVDDGSTWLPANRFEFPGDSRTYRTSGHGAR
jgi:hypothetical protein